MKKIGTGAIKDKKDKRDYKYSDIASAFAPFDWEKGFEIDVVLKAKDQNGSSSCGGQAWSYYGQVLDGEQDEKSAKFIYAHTHVGTGGSSGRDNCNLVINKGWGTEALTPSYEKGNAPSEAFMIRSQDITEEAYTQAKTDKALSYAQVNLDFDSIAQALRDNKGCVIGITGQNNGTWYSKYPKPPKSNYNTWNHWVYVVGAQLIDGKKYLKFINSWGDDVGVDGFQYIGVEHVAWIWSCWTLVKDFPLFKFTKTLMFGSFNDDVKQLQKRLGVMQTGFFGLLTRSAVKKYQTEHHLVSDGVVGPMTRAELNK